MSHEPSPNKLLWQFTKAKAPARWTSKQARALYSAALEAERSGRDAAHALRGSLRLEFEPEAGSPFARIGTPAEIAAQHVRDHIAKLRAEADRLETELATYGGSAFVMRREAIEAPRHPFDVEAVLLAILRSDRLSKIIVHGIKFARDRSGAFVRVEGENQQ